MNSGDTASGPKLDNFQVNELEKEAVQLSHNLDEVLFTLERQMKECAEFTLKSIEAYKLGIDSVGNTVEEGIQSTVELIRKCDELDKDFAAIHNLSAQIKNLNQTLDVLEGLSK
ncbi:hypothetical protein K493DRAFT_89654 [Basidiobolus meristosporus CBS 931.73]|uniref:BLOC-1-related complex subunit 6 C-terminal helix domain-containing protein n=1 Tax=Basidiobolus meristosporus CBS 931.73 TaxID=1314790 RepID=A0A1Y1XBY9_9FUNG|nr:hypothetical protein K493DRAFT_89654 [Basidiobolus meristosporus CBS 931.73]|eukprot:ORX83259.1 hypothetical protein K493DRAFT_89654 [Basidiobolus meristosporus CBS 931.73]